MPTTDFRIDFARYPEDVADLRRIREPVFIDEQSVPADMEWDELDETSVHVLARLADGSPIGTARLTPLPTIGRMAVLREWRGKGVGAALMRHLIDHAKSMGYPALELHAQTHAIGFYEQFGFTTFGPEYDEAGIPHRSMRLSFSSNDDRQLQRLESKHEVATFILDILKKGRRELVLYTRDLDPDMLNNADVLDALRQFCTSSTHARLRFLAHDLRRAVSEDHAIIRLAQRLPSRVAIRVVEEETDTQYASAFVLNDKGAYLFRPNATRFEASACLNDSATQRQYLRYFDEVWERARPASELRPL